MTSAGLWPTGFGVSVDAYCRYMGHAAMTGLKHYATVDEAALRKAHGG